MRFLRARVGPFVRFVEPFTLDLTQRGLVLVEGENRDSSGALDSNAALKSTLFEAIFAWCPFGKLVRTGNDVIGAEAVTWNGHGADVADDIETSRGVFTLHRQRSPRGAPTFEILDAQGAPLRGQTADVTRATADVTQLLGFDYTTLRSALFLHGEALGIDTYAREMAIIESILRFDDYTKAAKIASTRGQTADREHRALVDELERLSLQMQQSRGTLDDLASLDESDRERELIDSIAVADALLRERAVRIEARDLAATARDEAQRVVRITAKNLAQCEVEAQRIQDLSAHDACPTCGAPVAVGKHALAEALAAQQHAQREALDAEERAATEMQRYYDCNARVKEVEVAQEQHASATDELAALLQRKQRRQTMIDQHTERLQRLESRSAEITEQVATTRRQVLLAQKWTRERGYEELKALDLSRAMPILNDAAQRYSHLLSDGHVVVTFMLQRESRSESLVRFTVAGIETPYALMSSGERRRANIIMTLARRALARWRMRDTINVAVWDEVFDTLDESGLRRVAAVLDEDLNGTDSTPPVETVFIVTHHPRLREMFPHAQTMRVIREGGVSRIVEG